MSKNSPFPPNDRRPTDGAISARQLGEALQSGSLASQIADRDLLSFYLEDIPSEVLSLVIRGQEVRFRRKGNRLAATAGSLVIGFVPRRLAEQVESVVAAGDYSAWVSEVAHRAIQVTLKH